MTRARNLGSRPYGCPALVLFQAFVACHPIGSETPAVSPAPAGEVRDWSAAPAPTAGGELAVPGVPAEAGAVGSPARASYSTRFDVAQSSLSEHAPWHNSDPNQSNVRALGGLAYGTQAGDESKSGRFNDSIAYLTGFPPNQRASAVIHYTGAPIAGNLEVELLLRWSVGESHTGQWGPTILYGYEINLGQGVYGTFATITRWKDKTLFDTRIGGSPLATLGVHDGDTFAAEIFDNKITVWLGDTIIGSAIDPAPYPAGAPGIGFYRHDSPGPVDPTIFCFSSFAARALDGPGARSDISVKLVTP